MKQIIVHSFKMGDVEDPEIYAAQPIYEWEKSEHGQWVMQHSKTQPMFHIKADHSRLGYQIDITAELIDEDLTYHSLKWAASGV